MQIVVANPDSPDLVVINPRVDDDTPTPGQTFTIFATVRNQGTAPSDSTTLTYYRSVDNIITTADTILGFDPIPALAAGVFSEEQSVESIALNSGTYWVGACVFDVPGETNLGNQCTSTPVQIGIDSDNDRLPDSAETNK